MVHSYFKVYPYILHLFTVTITSIASMQMTFKLICLPSCLLKTPHIHGQLFFRLFSLEGSPVISNSTSVKFGSSLSSSQMSSVFFTFASEPNIGAHAWHIVGLYTASEWTHLEVWFLSLSFPTSLSLCHTDTHILKASYIICGA